MGDYVNLILEVDGTTGVAVLTINRADKMNALNRSLLEELDRAIDEVGDDARVRALIITGAGPRAFVAGADIGEIAALDGEESGVQFSRFGQEIFGKLETLPLPVIAAINGYALGGGCELAMCADIRLAGDNAQLGQPEVNLGVIPGYGGTQRLARIVGPDRAKALIFTGERINAEEALRIGLVHRVVPAADLMTEALNLANLLAQKAPRALALAKQAINEGIELPLERALDVEAGFFGEAIDTEDRVEGTQAFVEKRQPHWTGK